MKRESSAAPLLGPARLRVCSAPFDQPKTKGDIHHKQGTREVGVRPFSVVLAGGLNPQATLDQPGMSPEILSIFRARFSLHQRYIFLERHHPALQALHGD